MGLFSLFRPRHEVLREKIIFTQKARIASLEHEIDELKRVVYSKDKDMKEVRSNFERSKERLVDQIVTLSDKFADVHHRVMDLANENTSLKLEVPKAKHPAIERKEKGPAKAKKPRKAKSKKTL